MKFKLDEVCDFINGGAWSDKEYSEIGIPVLKVSNLQREGIDYTNISYIPEESGVKYSKHILFKDDLVIATVGSHPSLVNSAAGRSSIIPKIAEGYLLNQNAVCLRAKDLEVLDQKYLAYTGKTENFQHFIQQRGKGAANQMRIAIGGIKEYEIDLPKITIQRRISSILSAYDDMIENNLKRIKLLEELAQRTYEEWFVKFKVNGMPLVVNEETGLPDGWEKKKLVAAAFLTMGQSPKSEFYNKEKIGLPFHQGVSDYGFRFPTNSTWTTEGNRFAEQDDILFSVRAPVGRLNIAMERIVLGRGLSSIRHKKGFTSALFYQLQNIFFKDDLMGGGSIFNSVTKNDVEKVEIIVADSDASKKFNAIVEPIDRQIKNLTIQNRHLKESRDLLLPRLMNGSLAVKRGNTEGV